MLRLSKLILVVTICTMTASTTFAQNTNYPWRSNAKPTVSQSTPVRVATREPVPSTRVTQPVANNTTSTRVGRLKSLFGVSRQESVLNQAPQTGEAQNLIDALIDAQPSVSDLQQVPETASPAAETQVPNAEDYTFDTPAAPGQEAKSPAQAEPPLAVKSNATEEPNYCGRNCTPNFCNLGCEKKLFGKNCRGLEIGGWASVGYHNRPNILVNNRPGKVDLHQFWLYAENQASRCSDSWDIGYRLDLLYGLDGQDLQAFGNAPTGAPAGWDNTWDFGSFGWALPQAYVQLANASWDIKLGKFFSPFGYEVIGAPNNFFYSHSFTMYNTEPFTMTGVLAERQVSENRSVVMGVTAGWDTGFESNSGGNLILGTRFQPMEFVNISSTASYGDTGYRGVGVMSSTVAELQLTENVEYVLQADILNLGTNQEFGIVQYLFRDLNPCLALGARLEWWKSDAFFTSSRSTYNFTMGANYRKSANLTLRPEVRFDWGAAAIDPGQAIIGIDAVMTF